MKPFRLALSLLCYWIGDTISRLTGVLNERACAGHRTFAWLIWVTYPVESRFLFWSCDLDTEGHLWSKPDENACNH